MLFRSVTSKYKLLSYTFDENISILSIKQDVRAFLIVHTLARYYRSLVNTLARYYRGISFFTRSVDILTFGTLKKTEFVALDTCIFHLEHSGFSYPDCR